MSLAGLTMRYTYYDDNTPATATADSRRLKTCRPIPTSLAFLCKTNCRSTPRTNCWSASDTTATPCTATFSRRASITNGIPWISGTPCESHLAQGQSRRERFHRRPRCLDRCAGSSYCRRFAAGDLTNGNVNYVRAFARATMLLSAWMRPRLYPLRQQDLPGLRHPFNQSDTLTSKGFGIARGIIEYRCHEARVQAQHRCHRHNVFPNSKACANSRSQSNFRAHGPSVMRLTEQDSPSITPGTSTARWICPH